MAIYLVFSAFTENNAKGTAVKGALLISVKSVQLAVVLNSTLRLFWRALHKISSKVAAYPPATSPKPMVRFTIPYTSVVILWVSIYSSIAFSSIIENRKQIFLFASGALLLLNPGNSCVTGSIIKAW